MKRKIFSLAGSALILLLVAAACGGGQSSGSPATSGASFPLTIPESDGQRLTLDSPRQRIVSLSPHATEILCAIGAGDQLVAVDKFANCPRASKSKPEVDSFQPNLEAIAGFKPDLVYVFSDQGNIVQALRGLGTPVLYLSLPTTIEGTFENILLFGRITGRTKEAADLVASMRKRVDAVKARVSDVREGPRFFHEVDATLYTVGPDTFVGELYKLLKGQNIAADAVGAYPQLSSETVVARDPQVIVLADGEKPAAVRARPGWGTVSAVRSNRICEVDPDLASQPGPRLVDGLEALAKCLYPDR